MFVLHYRLVGEPLIVIEEESDFIVELRRELHGEVVEYRPDLVVM
jgi:hypothetical protein